ncbi:hypothetical protein LCGC14_1614020 [marine sediment metagenome]|uniref:Uncharacterized protein n=1 Tax=marine sediment metagenome TaxID=412755 RepID=A0A0F9L7M3_9ZZZZ
MYFTDEERAYMDYLDDLVPDVPCGSYGLLLRKGDPTAFEIGMNEWLDSLTDQDRENLDLAA